MVGSPKVWHTPAGSAAGGYWQAYVVWLFSLGWESNVVSPRRRWIVRSGSGRVKERERERKRNDRSIEGKGAEPDEQPPR